MSLKKVREVLNIIGRSYLAGEIRNSRDKYAKDDRTPPLIQVYKTKKQPAKHARKSSMT